MRSVSSMVTPGLVRAVCRSFGTLPRAMLLRSVVQISGTNSRRRTITGTSRAASVTQTGDCQLVVYPGEECIAAQRQPSDIPS